MNPTSPDFLGITSEEFLELRRDIADDLEGWALIYNATDNGLSIADTPSEILDTVVEWWEGINPGTSTTSPIYGLCKTLRGFEWIKVYGVIKEIRSSQKTWIWNPADNEHTFFHKVEEVQS